MGFLNDAQKKQLAERGDVDFAYATTFGRFRASVVRQRIGIDLVFRIISTKLRTMDELGLPESLKLLTQYHNGLVLVTGSVGSGKSTTLAALVEEVNATGRTTSSRSKTRSSTSSNAKDATSPSAKCTRTRSHSAPRCAARCAKIRTSSWSVKCATWRRSSSPSPPRRRATWCWARLHTANASRTLDRVLDVFPVDQREQIRIMVSESLARHRLAAARAARRTARGRALALEILDEYARGRQPHPRSEDLHAARASSRRARNRA